jgi:WD40 repeat protein
MQNLLTQALQEFIKLHGTLLAHDHKRCESFLRDKCGDDHKREIFILINASREGVTKELLNPSPGLPLETVCSTLVQRLYDNLGIKKEFAEWAIQTWGTALGVAVSFQTPTYGTPPPVSAKLKFGQFKTEVEPPPLPESDNLLRTLHGHKDWVVSVAYSPDGRTLASASFDTSVRIWDTRTGRLLRTIMEYKEGPKKGHREGHSDWVFAVAFSPRGGTLASASRDNTVRLWNTKTGKGLFTLKQGGRMAKTEVFSVAYSNDGRTLASASKDNMIQIWDNFTGEKLGTLKGHGDWVFHVAYSPDGYTLASASRDNTVKLWEVSTGYNLRTLEGHNNGVLCLSYSPDGNTLVSASYDQTIKFWDVQKGQEIRTLSGHGSVYSIVYSPDGNILASGNTEETGSTIKLWDAHTGKLLRTLYGHKSRIGAIAYSPDGHTLASASYDKTIKLWKL